MTGPTYGHLHYRLPVATGSVWAVGWHRLACADFREVAALGLLTPLLGEPFDEIEEVRTFPPPDEHAAVMALRHAGRPQFSVHYLDLLVRFADLVVTVAPRARLVVRMRSRTLGAWGEIAAAREFVLESVSAAEDSESGQVWWTGRASEEAPPESGVLLDPFAGRGDFLAAWVRGATAQPRKALGIELVPKKAPVALIALERVVGVEPSPLWPPE